MLLLTINLIFFADFTSLTKIILPQTNNATISEKFILNKYQDYDYIYHYTNSTATDFTITNKQTALLINYDYKITSQVPPTVRYFHIILLENINNLALFQHFNTFDIVLFIIYKNYRHVLVDHVRFAGGIFVYYKLTGNLYTTCYYCGENTKEMEFIGNSTSSVPEFTKYINNFTDFHANQFKIGYANYDPFFKWSNNQENGMESEILQVLSKQLNFHYQLMLFNDTQDASPWENMIKGVENRLVDWAISGISVSEKRYQTTQFTRIFKSDSFRILFSVQKDPWLMVKRIIFLMQWPVILCIILTILIIISISKLWTKLHRIQTQTTFYFLKASIIALLEQATTNIKHISTSHYTIRMLFLLWWLLSVCLMTYYKSKWASLLTKPPENNPANVDDLVRHDYRFKANYEDWSLLKDNLLSSTNPVYKKLLKNVDNNLPDCQAIIYAVNNKAAVIDEETALEYQIYNQCIKNITSHTANKLRVLKDHLFPGDYHGWCMQKSTPFQRQFSAIIAKLDSAGLLNYWYKSEINKRDLNFDLKDFTPLQLFDILAPFILLGFGLIFATIAFIVEQLWR